MNEDNRRIAKNTLLLYCRTFITMIVGVYTGRIMFVALGIDNYGIQNVVGGIVAMTTIITGTMTSASSRYITYSLGEGNMAKLKTVFVTTVNSQIILAFIAVILLEVIGVWWLNAGANIPEGRMYAANWVLHCSIIALFVNLLSVPYRSCIVAHEHMSIYAYMSLADVVLRLLIVFAIINYGGDRLILLSNLSLGVSAAMTIFYCVYGRIKFNECRYRPHIDKNLLKDMTSYSGWNLLYNSAWMLSTQGVNMLINVFFGVVYNAARGVANTVNGCVQGFVNNYTIAFTPQLTKSYASGDYERCFLLANRGSRVTWLLMLLFIVPICIEAKMLLYLWLGKVPPFAPLFLQFAMFESLSISYSNTLFQIIQANGNVKRYTIESSIFLSFIFPITWVAYKLGAPVWISYPIFITFFILLLLIRFRILSRITTYKCFTFVRDVIKPCLLVTILSFSVPLFLSFIFTDSIVRFFVLVPTSVAWTSLIVFRLGLKKEEREFIINKLRNILKRMFYIHGKRVYDK